MSAEENRKQLFYLCLIVCVADNLMGGFSREKVINANNLVNNQCSGGARNARNMYTSKFALSLFQGREHP